MTGGTATFSLPTGPRYHSLLLQTFLGGVLDDADDIIDRVRLKVNEVTIWDVTAAQLLKEAELNGVTVDTGSLPLFFSEPWRADKTDEEITAWDTFGERSFKVELVIKPALVGVVLVTGQMTYDFDGLVIDGVRRKSIIRKLAYTFNAPAGAYDIDTLNIRYPILRLLMDGTQAINWVEVTADSRRVFEATLFQNTELLNNYGFDAGAASFRFPVVFDHSEQLKDFLEVQKSLNVRIDSAAGQAVNILQESIAPGFM